MDIAWEQIMVGGGERATGVGEQYACGCVLALRETAGVSSKTRAPAFSASAASPTCGVDGIDMERLPRAYRAYMWPTTAAVHAPSSSVRIRRQRPNPTCVLNLRYVCSNALSGFDTVQPIR